MIKDLVVELVSPAMIGGADARKCDEPPCLRPPSLRGQLRFWSRALGGQELADELWGRADGGQRVRLISARSLPDQPLGSPATYALLPHKSGSARVKTQMIPPGGRVHLRFAMHQSSLMGKLSAVVWVWLHLGGVGRRSRRGYGSFLWVPTQGDLLTGYDFVRSRDLRSPATLAEYLCRGLDEVWGRLGITPLAERRNRAEFGLLSKDQVFVGKEPLSGGWRSELVGEAGRDCLQAKVKGLDEQQRGPAPDCEQLGRPSSKPSSPMVWRLFPCTREGHIPVMVWSPLGYSLGETPQIGTRLAEYLNGLLRFETSLAGNELIAP